jgi:hypothetical protein
LKPYWGKPAVQNFRRGDGNVGIIRSPVRAIVPLDLLCACAAKKEISAIGSNDGFVDVKEFIPSVQLDIRYYIQLIKRTYLGTVTLPQNLGTAGAALLI